ncbi:HEAT repeat domain-containing protein [Planctomycetota bacterium]|nr:HEAT repeat domain-containing protein [Planctomycetota bacterium]
MHTFREGEIRNLAGATRNASSVKLPAHAGKIKTKIKLPKRTLSLATVKTITKWTWNSIGIAAGAHIILFAVTFFFQDDILKIIDHVTKVESLERVAVAPAPEESETISELPELEMTDDEITAADFAEKEPIDVGDEIELPPSDVYAPAPKLNDIRPNKPVPFPIRRPNAASGLGGGQRAPATMNRTSGSGLFKNRSGDTKKAALKIFGGGAKTEGAVNLGLEYLASKQTNTGYWKHSDGFAGDARNRDTGAYRTSMTALCTLPFLAAGNSTKEGKYQKNVEKAIKYLMRRQTSDGCVRDDTSQMYGHSVATLALCEAYGLSGDKKLKIAAEKAIQFLERTQNSGGGWDYTGQVYSSRRAVRERNDLSISGWAVLAFKSADAVGLTVSKRSKKDLTGLYDRLSLSNGETYYADESTGALNANRKGIGMVGVGLTARVALDAEKFRRRNNAAENLLLKDLPEYEKFFEESVEVNNPNFHTFYGWYYGTLGMFLHTQGKGASWKIWNDKLKASLLDNQVLTGDRKGSWHNDDAWIGPHMGDLYSTACATLCLEVYYRYNPSHKHETDIVLTRPSTPEPKTRTPRKMKKPIVIAGETLDMAVSGHRSKYLRLKAKESGLEAVPELLNHLEDESETVRSTALFELGKLKAKDSAETVGAMLEDFDNEDLKSTILYTLGELGDKAQSKRIIKQLGSRNESVVVAARHALGQLSGGKDFGINKRAWQAHFESNR